MKTKLIILLTVWLVFNVLQYFVIDYFFQPLIWLAVCVVLAIISLVQITRSIKEIRTLRPIRTVTLSLASILFVLTFYKVNKIPDSVMETIDWKISYEKRNEIVRVVENGRLKPNTEMNNGICRLPFEFPIISNGGNEIWIFEKKMGQIMAIKFWISRGFFESSQTYFIYTRDLETKKYYQTLIKREPEHNWALEENWFRIMEN